MPPYAAGISSRHRWLPPRRAKLRIVTRFPIHSPGQVRRPGPENVRHSSADPDLRRRIAGPVPAYWLTRSARVHNSMTVDDYASLPEPAAQPVGEAGPPGRARFRVPTLSDPLAVVRSSFSAART